MSDDTTEATETATEESTKTTTTETAVDWQAEAEKWKTLSRKNEETAKANSSAAKKLAEIEEANKSELEKAQARAAAAEQREQEALGAKLRSDVAADKGVPAVLLTGSTQEELEAAADALLAFKGTTPKTPTSEGQGKTGEPVGQAKQIQSLDELKKMSREEIVQARQDGRLAAFGAGADKPRKE